MEFKEMINKVILKNLKEKMKLIYIDKKKR